MDSSRRRARGRRAAKGFTLVELMIAMVLGLLMGAAVLKIFLFSRHSFDRDENVLRMQDDARQAVRELSNDLEMAGFWADLVLPGAIVSDSSLAIGSDCGPAGVSKWIYAPVTAGTDESLAVASVDNATGGSASTAFSCIDPTEIVPGTDVIAIKRVAGAEAKPPRSTDTVYLRTNGTLGLLFKEPASSPPAVDVPLPYTEWEYRPSIYYVRNFAVDAGDGVPTLCRKVLQFGSPPTMVTECLAQGVENLQVEFGLDADGNGEPDYYVSGPTQAQLQTAVSARIYVLARSAEADPEYTNGKTYQIGNAPSYSPGDHYYRRVYSVTVTMHNLRSLRLLRS